MCKNMDGLGSKMKYDNFFAGVHSILVYLFQNFDLDDSPRLIIIS